MRVHAAVRRLALLSTTIALVVSGEVGRAAELVLREAATPAGPVLRLGDVADIAAATPQEVHELATTPLGPAPRGAEPTYLTVLELRDLLAARGLDVGVLQISGAERTVIDPTAPRPKTFADGPSTVPSVTPEDAAEALRQAVLRRLQEASGVADWEIAVPAQGAVVAAVAQAKGEVRVTGGRAPWTGRQRFQLVDPRGGDTLSVEARVQPVTQVLCAARKIERGMLVGAADVALRRHLGEVPRDAATQAGQAVGKEALQPVAEGEILLVNHVRAPLLVRRGERVEVRSRTAGVLVRTYATALQDGSVGDLVTVETTDRGERFGGRAVDRQTIEILALGAPAAVTAAAR